MVFESIYGIYDNCLRLALLKIYPSMLAKPKEKTQLWWTGAFDIMTLDPSAF